VKSLSIVTVLLVVACIVGVFGCDTSSSPPANGGDGGGNGGGGNGGGFDPTIYAGNWTGQWLNTTYTTTGAASATVTVDQGAGTVSFNMDMDGNVLGGTNPPPVDFTGTYNATGATFNATGTVFGDVAATVDANGNISGTLTNLPGGNVNRVEVTGSLTATTMNINYTVFFTGGGTANGVLTLNKV